MLPLLQAEEIKQSVTEYLKATFSFADRQLRQAFEDFLMDKRKGMFKGPYLQIRLPFSKEGKMEELNTLLEIKPDFTPFDHQFEAFRRLSARNGHNPEPVILTTGTGSGKTESFLFPILDYCYQHQDQPGIKAIILYPMNALATDQAKRLASIIFNYQNEKSEYILREKLRAGLFIGEGKDKKSSLRAIRMGEENIIEDRDTLVQSPPDILLTNFKMLDFSLMQARFHGIWKYNFQNPELLKYLVLDELHTYDGAKGSDVANLIRRLKLKLKLPEDLIVPIGTSATMSGGDEGKESLVKFFSQIFGFRVGLESIIEESRLDPDLFFESEMRIPEVSRENISTCEFKEEDDYHKYINRQLVFWNYPEISPIDLGAKLRENRWVYDLVTISRGSNKEISEIVSIWADKTSNLEDYSNKEQYLIFSSLLALITYAKDQSGTKAFPFLFVQITYWMRSLHRMLRKTQTTPVFEWESDVNPSDKVKSLPPYYCRECGGSGWVGIKKEHSDQFEDDLARTRQLFMSDRGNKNIFLISANPNNDIASILAEDYSPTGDSVIGYLDPYSLNILERNQHESLFRIIGVRRQNDDKIEKVCPHCNSVNTLALIGTGLPTLESIATAQVLATSTDQAPDQQRKLLAFTNGVQDAAHQAGFIENRNYRFGMRHAIQKVLKNQESIIPLNNLYKEFEKYWKHNIEAKKENKAEAYYYKYLPPDCESRIDISDFQFRNGGFKPVFENEFSNRMAWEIWSEFSYNASIGRTLEKSGASATGFSVETMEKIYDQMKKWLQDNALGERITSESFLKFLNGFLHRLRTRGGVDHLYLNRYRTGKSQSYLITYKMNRDHFMIRSFGPAFRLPRFITLDKGRYTDVFDVVKISKNQNWYSTYFLKSFPLIRKEETELINDFYTQLVDYLDANEVLDKKVAAGIVNYGLKPDQINIFHENTGFDCDTCGHQLHVCKGNENITSEMSCMQYRCPGHYKSMDEEFLNYYRMIYNRGRSLRIFAHDHTGLIDRDKREQLEKDFKERPSYKSINVLVATSTLEMGIDIGDLNVAFNSSLPPETSNYLQRVGRAGRSSGNSLILNIAGRGEHDLFFYQDPMSMMNGMIRTPACYLEAKDILKRHFMAFCFDSWASLDPDQNRIPHIVKQLKVKSLEPGDSQFILSQISNFIHSNKSELFDKFSEQYKTDIPEDSTVINDLKEQLISGFLESRLIDVHKRLRDELNYYEKRKKQLADRLKNLPQTGDESQFLRSELRALSGAINNIYRRNTIEYLTNIGILPNYAFPETGVSINPILRKRKELDGVVEYKNEELPEIVRPSSQAITELAPANFFYSQGHKFESQGIEVLSADEYEEYRFCSNCDYMVSEVNVGKDELSCPKCGHNSWGSINNKKTLLKIRAVLSYNDYEESKITDSSDERDRKFYQRSIHIQTDAGSSKGARILKRVPFGIEFFANTRYVDINTGVREEGFFGTREIEINDEKVPEVGFVICKTCGKTTERKLTDKEIEKRKRAYHFPYCSNRDQQYVGHKDELFEEIYLYREFQTEALKILLPVQEFRTEERVSVFKAGLFLGLKDYYKGHPDHVNIKEYQEFNKENGRKERYLVMYETIPGGTGYLSRLFDPVEFTRLLEAAYDHIRFCKCKDEGKDGCYHCIYTYGNQYERDVLSRKEAEELFGSIVEKTDEWNEIDSLQGAGNYANNEESDLENGFIEILKEKETTWPGWKFTDINEAGYKKYKLVIPLKDGSISYEIWPQNLGNYLSGIELKTRPDFVFRCVSITSQTGETSMEEVQKVKDIIIYLDGYEYHASKDHRRLPSDIKIRNSIISSGKYHLWIFTWKDIEDHKKALNDYLGEFVQESTIKSMLKGHPSFKGHQESNLNYKNNFQRFLNLLSSPINFINPKIWSSLILFSLQKEMLSDCYPEDVIKSSFIHTGKIDNSMASRGDPEKFAHINDFRFNEELLMEVFIHPKDFLLIGYSRFDDEKLGWEIENWNKFWESYNLTQFHQIISISYKDHEKTGESRISEADDILDNFDPELHEVVKILIDNKIKINEDYDFDLIKDDEIIAQAELGSYETMFFCNPFDEDSKKIFIENGYKELFIEKFDIQNPYNMSQSITLFMHDSFMDSFSDLPKKIQKKTREFMKKFKEDPTSSGINYEKIATFNDQSLRTVRIDQKYRAIIQQPKKGTGYHLLWVDNHDEAMAWATNKVFEWNQNTQSFQMYDKPEIVSQQPEKKETSPLAKYSKENLLAVGSPESMLETVWGLESIEDLNGIKSNLPVDTYEYLYYLFEGISLEEILEEINAGKTAEEGEISDNAKKHIYVLTEDEELEKMLSGDFEKWKVYLHPSQKKIAYGNFNGPIKVTGGAGTGKTVCAMHRAGYLSKALELFDKSILFTTYTKSLTAYLKSTMKDFNIPEEKLVIKNFDKLVFELARNPEYQVIPSDAGFLTESQEKEVWRDVLEYIPSTKDENFLSEEYNEVILKNNVKDLNIYLRTSRVGRSTRIGRQDKTEIWKLVEEFRKRKAMNYSKYEVCNLIKDYFETRADRPFSHLICDEVQDFSNVELSAMRVLVKEKQNDLFFVGDPYQNIYARKINFSKSGISIRGRRSKKLKLNYRTTEEIKLQALKVVNQEVYDDFDGGIETIQGYISLMHGNDPAYQVFNTPEEEDSFLIESVKRLLGDEKLKGPEICICGRTNHIVDQIKMVLNKNEISYHDLSSSKENISSIRVSTFHSLKGHEFKYLFLKGVAKDTVPFKHTGFNYYEPKDKEEYLKCERSLYYVVFTRAREGLVITGVGERSAWI